MLVNNGLKVTKAWFIETGTAPDMVSRNFTTHVTPEAVHQFAERTRGGELITEDNLAGVAGTIIQPDANFERQVAIANGWNNPRYRFLLRVANPETPNGVVYYYSGYTDTPNWSIVSNDFAPDMRMYFNNAIQVNVAMRHTPTGPVPYVTVHECSHMIHPATLGAMSPSDFNTTFNPNNGFGVQNQPSTLRPSDLMTTISSGEKNKMAGISNDLFLDMRTGVDLCKSSRRNALPSYYLHKTTDAFIYGANQVADQQGVHNPAAPYDIAAGYAAERSAFADRFFSLLAVDYGYHQNGFVTWQEFNRAHPEVQMDGVTYVFTRGEAQKHDVYISDRGNFDSMVGDRRPQTLLITQIMQSIPGVLLESLISFARIRVTNTTVDNSVIVSIVDPMSFADLPEGYLITQIPHLEQRLKHIIFNDIAFSNYVPFDLSLTVDIFGESFALLGYNGQPQVPYSIPTYCDSMLSPIVTTNGNVLGTMANDVRYLVGQTVGFGSY